MHAFQLGFGQPGDVTICLDAGCCSKGCRNGAVACDMGGIAADETRQDCPGDINRVRFDTVEFTDKLIRRRVRTASDNRKAALGPEVGRHFRDGAFRQHVGMIGPGIGVAQGVGDLQVRRSGGGYFQGSGQGCSQVSQFHGFG